MIKSYKSYYAKVNIKEVPDNVAIPAINAGELTFKAFDDGVTYWAFKCSNKATQQYMIHKYGFNKGAKYD